MSKWRLRGPVVCVLSVIGLACSSERQATQQDAGDAPEGPPHATDGLIMDAGAGGHMVTVDPIGSAIMPVPDAGNLGSLATPQNVSFATARPFEIGTELSQRVFTGLQADYYRFEPEPDTFYELRTNRSDFSADCVISVFDAQHRLVGENDSGSFWPGDGLDARLVLRFAHTGTYYVRVEDRSTPDEQFRNPFGPALAYRLRIRAIDADTPGFARSFARNDTDEPAEVQFEGDANSGNAHVTLLGVLGQSAVFDLAGQAAHALIGQLELAGIAGDGSTAHGVQVQVAQEDGRVLSTIEQDNAQLRFHPPVADGRYHLQVKTSGPVGDNDFYAIDMVLLEDNPSEQSEAQNSRLEMAETLEWKGSARRRALLLARLPAGDVDFYRLDLSAGEHLSILCEGESGGSGVRGVHAEVVDAKQHVLASADEQSTLNLVIEDVSVMQLGTYYLRLSSSTPRDGDLRVDPWVRCAVLAAP